MTTPAVAWFEITGKDGPALQQFYGRLFDWSVQDAGDGSGYGLIQAADKGIGGGIGAAQDGGPARSAFYVEVDDPQPPTSRRWKARPDGRPPTEIPQFGPQPLPSSPTPRATWWACQGRRPVT